MIGFVKNIEILNVYLERARKTECNDEVFVFHLMIFLRNFHSSYQITLKVKYKTNIERHYLLRLQKMSMYVPKLNRYLMFYFYITTIII